MSAYWLLVPLLLPIFGGAALGIIKPHSRRVMEITGLFHRDLRKYDSFVISMCIEGDCEIRVRSTGERVVLREGSSTLIPAAIARSVLRMPRTAPSPKNSPTRMASFDGEEMPSALLMALSAEHPMFQAADQMSGPFMPLEKPAEASRPVASNVPGVSPMPFAAEP